LNSIFNTEETVGIIEEINSAEKIPKEFHQVFYSLYKTKSANQLFLDRLLGNYDTDCPCILAAYYSNLTYLPVKNRLLANQYSLAWKLEKYFSQEQCLNFVAKEADFLYGSLGIKKASEFYFNKDIHDLNTREYQTLALMLENPSLYNPMRFPENIEQRLDALQN
jgi:hypothetical protein